MLAGAGSDLSNPSAPAGTQAHSSGFAPAGFSPTYDVRGSRRCSSSERCYIFIAVLMAKGLTNGVLCDANDNYFF